MGTTNATIDSMVTTPEWHTRRRHAAPASATAQYQRALDAVQRAGIPGLHAEIRHGDRIWRGAAGFADLDTRQPIQPDMVHRVGSVTKSFTATAVLQQVEQGRIELDEAIGTYLPQLVPGARGAAITVRMLLGHTSGLPDYLGYAFPSVAGFPSAPADVSPASLDEHRYTRFDPVALIGSAVEAPPATSAPGSAPGVYSNTNYLLLAQLLESVCGTTAERYITENVIERAGLERTGFPVRPAIDDPHPRMYEAMYGLLDPPRDYSVYDMSWVRPAAGLVSTTTDLNRFYRALLGGELVRSSSLDQMQQTGPVIAMDGSRIEYGLGLHRVEIPDHGVFWGHDGTVFGAFTLSLTSSDGSRQYTVALNAARWNILGPRGLPQRHPIDDALDALRRTALCGD